MAPHYLVLQLFDHLKVSWEPPTATRDQHVIKLCNVRCGLEQVNCVIGYFVKVIDMVLMSKIMVEGILTIGTWSCSSAIDASSTPIDKLIAFELN